LSNFLLVDVPSIAVKSKKYRALNASTLGYFY
jgi:hypothetical protein